MVDVVVPVALAELCLETEALRALADPLEGLARLAPTLGAREVLDRELN